MTKPKQARIVDLDGLQGTVEQVTLEGDSAAPVLVQLDSGERVLVPRELLSKESEGGYTLGTSLANFIEAQSAGPSDEPLVVPVIEESARIERVARETAKVELTKTVAERIEHIDEPLLSEEVEVERVTVNRPVDEAPAVRREGETLVIPLLEEVLVVQKRLVLREEVRVRKLRKEVHSPQEVSLRSEQIDVTRKPVSSSDPTNAAPTASSTAASTDERSS